MFTKIFSSHPGYVAPNTRHNIRKQQFAPMMRATFEEPLKNFVDAAVHAEQDPINGKIKWDQSILIKNEQKSLIKQNFIHLMNRAEFSESIEIDNF